MKATVAITKGENPSEMTQKALELSGIGEALRGKKSIIKLNLSGGPSGKAGAVVSEAVTRAAAEYLKGFCSKVTLCDGGRPNKDAVDTLFQRTWAARLAQELDVELVNLWDTEMVTVAVPQPQARQEWTVPKVLLDYDAVGTLAVMKVSMAAGVTLGMKNLFGVLPIENKYFLHPQIHEVLLDLYQIIRPSFGIIDGTWGWEAGESIMGGRPIQADVVLASRDVVALDTIGTLVMGLDPRQVKNLRLAGELKLGAADPGEIEIRGASIADARRDFEPAPGTFATASR